MDRQVKMKSTILYIYPTFATFIKRDLDFLSEKFRVITPKHHWGNKQFAAWNFVRQLVFILRYLFRCKAIFVMFGGYWSFLPALLGRMAGKPVYIILGGADCVSFPTIQYGSLRKPLLRTFIRWSYRLCSKLIPVDESLVFSQYQYFEPQHYQFQGYKYHLPKVSTPYEVIYNGFDPVFFSHDISHKRPDSFIAIAAIPDNMRLKLKGIDLLLELAKIYPQCSFTVVGISDQMIERLGKVSENVTLISFLAQEKMKEYMLTSQYVVQLSISEGFPNAICEAMLCGCIPIGSAVGAMPHIISDTGFIMQQSDFGYLQNRFAEILRIDDQTKIMLAQKARTRVIENFHINQRKEAFYKLIGS